MLRLLDPTEGSVRCDGVDLRGVDPAAWRSHLAWLPQRPTIFAGSLEDNVRLACPDASEAAVRRALADAGIEALVAALPDGLATLVGEGGRTLSAGEAQRVALARAILRDAPLIVADEPTAHLDAVTAAAVGDALLAAAGRTHPAADHAPFRPRPARGPLRGARAALGGRGARIGRWWRDDRPERRRPPHRRCVSPRAGCGVWSRLTGPVGHRLRLSVVLGAAAILSALALLAVSGTLISRAALRPEVLTLLTLIVATRVLSISRAGFRYGERLASHDLALRSLARLRVRLYERLAPLVPGSLPGLRPGDALSRFVGDVETLQDLYLRAIAPPLVAGAVLLATGGFLLVVLPAAAPVLAAGLIVAGLALPAATVALSRRSGLREAPARGRLVDQLVEVSHGAAELVVAGREADAGARVRKPTERCWPIRPVTRPHRGWRSLSAGSCRG